MRALRLVCSAASGGRALIRTRWQTSRRTARDFGERLGEGCALGLKELSGGLLPVMNEAMPHRLVPVLREFLCEQPVPVR